MKFVALVVVVALVCCKGKPNSSKVLQVNEMKTILWDMINADEWFNQIPTTDSLHKTRRQNIRLYEQVFALHSVNKTQFYNSYQYYQTRPDKMKILLDSVSAYGERVKNNYKPQKK